jgi:hypothetical protein
LFSSRARARGPDDLRWKRLHLLPSTLGYGASHTPLLLKMHLNSIKPPAIKIGWKWDHVWKQ